MIPLAIRIMFAFAAGCVTVGLVIPKWKDWNESIGKKADNRDENATKLLLWAALVVILLAMAFLLNIDVNASFGI